MLQDPALRDADQRVGELAVRIRRLAPHRWHATITVLHPATSVQDETVPIVDLGIFRTTHAARSATDLVTTRWSWTS